MPVVLVKDIHVYVSYKACVLGNTVYAAGFQLDAGGIMQAW